MADVGGVGASQTSQTQTTADTQTKKSKNAIDTSKVASATDTKKNGNNSLDKDAFLKLLVTQMQYQDPLEPTSNTEYMSQMAQFSSVEQMQNLNTLFTNGQAMNLTGQYVILNVPDAAGNISQVSGLVDYVTLKDGETYFHIGEEYYKSSYLDSVVSLDYLEYLAKNANNEQSNTEGSGDDAGGNDDDKDKTDGTENA
ncbi:MAG: hypothetical protein K2I10_13815 [Lachnospiraceae bacterium]|nr:hypothetical protein [Lachnospiraceae bacterium]